MTSSSGCFLKVHVTNYGDTQERLSRMLLRLGRWARFYAKNEPAQNNLCRRRFYVGLNRKPIGVAGAPMVNAKGAVNALSWAYPFTAATVIV